MYMVKIQRYDTGYGEGVQLSDSNLRLNCTSMFREEVVEARYFNYLSRLDPYYSVIFKIRLYIYLMLYTGFIHGRSSSLVSDRLKSFSVN